MGRRRRPSPQVLLRECSLTPGCDGRLWYATTEHYSHLGPDLFSEKASEAVSVDLSKPEGNVLSLSPSCPNEYTMTTTQEDTVVEQLA